MKAFSFQTILKNFGKQLSSLASQMPWCNLRFNLGSMSVLSRVNPLFSRRASHFAAMIFAVLTLSVANIGMAWGASVDTLFSQDFSGSGSLTYTQNVTLSKASGLAGIVGNADNLLTSVTTNNKNTTGIAINNTTGGNSTNTTGFFQAYFNNTSGYWSAIRTNDFATTAPTAIKVTMDVWFGNLGSSSSACLVNVAVGDGFTESLKSSSVEATSLVHSGWGITVESSPKLCAYNTYGTKIYSTALSYSTWYSITWVINNSGEELTYANPTGSDTSTLANDKYDIWIKTHAQANSSYTRVASAIAATTAAKDLQELYFGHAAGKKHEFRLDNIVVTDLTPSCTAPTNVKISGDYVHFPGENLTLTVSGDNIAQDATYTWKKGDQVIAGQTTATLTINSCEITDAGNYTCTVSNGDGCAETANFTVKMYSLRGLTDNNWSTDFVFTKVNATTATYSMELAANSSYQFKVYDGSAYYGNEGDNPTMTSTNCTNWTMKENSGNNVTLQTTFAGTYTFTLDYTDASNPKISVTYPQKQMVYLNPNMWDADNATEVYTVYSWVGDENAFTEMTKVNECENIYQALIDIAHTQLLFIRGDKAYNSWDANRWNQSIDLTCQADGLYIIDAWENDGNEYWKEGAKKSLASNSGTYTPATYSITFEGNGNTDGSMTNVTGITCGEGRTLAVNGFTRTGYTFAGWATSANGDVAHADKATISNITSDITLYAKWNINSYTVTWKPAGGNWAGNTDNIVQTYEYGAKINAPEKPSRTGYEFVEWNPTYVVNETTMPAANTTYTATWTAKTTTITINANTANHGSTTPGNVTATYGSALPSFTPATGASGYSLIGYFTAATSGTKVINADGTLVASTDYADGSGKWKSEDATLTLFAQYEKEAPAPAGDCGEIIKSTFSGTKNTSSTPSTTTFNTTGKIGGTSTSAIIGSEGKLNTEGAYLILKLSTGTFLAGDTIKISSNKSGGVKFATGTVSTQTYTLIGTASTATSGGQPYYFVLAANADSIIVPRGSDKSDYNQNPEIAYVSVHRPCPECAATPDAPTGFTAESITSTGATFSITDTGDAASYDIYYSTSSDAPTTGTTATTTSDSKTKEVTGLTASTTYYAWVRSVCDASHKSDWVALGTTSFTTAAAETALVNWTLAVNTTTWSATATSTSDGTNITSIATTSDAGGSNSASSDKTGKIALADGENNVTKAASFTFTVSSGKKVVPEKVTCQVANVGGSSNNQLSYKAQLSDNNGHVYYSTNTEVPSNNGTLNFYTFNFASDLVLVGNVTMKVYCWRSGNSGDAFRMGADVKLFGEVQNAADYTVTHTLSNVTKSSGATSVKEGNTYTATYAASSGYTLPSTITVTIGGASKTVDTDYMWNSETGVVTIPSNKVTGNIVITVTGVVAATYALNYECNGAESGCPSNTTASALPNPLPSAPTKDGYTFGGWFTDEDLTVAAVASAAMTEATTLYAKWTVNSSSECITITDFATSNVNNTCGDGNSKIFYGYKGSVSDTNALTITTNDGNDRGQNSGAEMRLTYNKLMRIYANNTTNAAPATFSNVTSVSFKWKFIASGNSGNTELTSSYTVKVGSTTIANAVSITGKTQDGYQTVTIDNPAQLSGYVEIKFSGSSSSYNVYLDDIEICTASMSYCTTPVLSNLEDQKVCPGSNVEWTANNTEDLADGETITYQWTKKGNATILSPTATLTLNDVTEAAGGTYVVTAIVSAEGKASKTATKEVTLTVTPATATPTITANANTIYTGNDVTLTASCASSGVGYQWYTCTDAEGNGASEIGEAENAEYTFTAGEAGTYYYKVIVTGDGTHSCGTAEEVYTLVVSAAIDASDCTTYFWFPYAEDATSNDVTNNENNFFGNSPKTGSSNSSTYNFELDDKTYTATKNTGSAQFTISFTVPENSIGTMAINCKGSSSKPLYLKHTDDTQILVSDNSSDKNFVIENITPGTWTLQSLGNWALSGMAVKVCSGSTCTDPQVTATIEGNATVCEDTENVTFTATNYADGATFQWQKKNGNTWENIDATSATYTISHVTTAHAGQYRVIAKKECSRTSEELTLTVLTAPEFNAFANTASVMKGNALTINDVEATNATDYTWYKSADNSFDVEADTKVGTTKELLLAASSITEEADQAFYLFCVASNSCGSVTSNAITVTVTPFVEEECATKGNEGNDHEFGFVNTDCSSDTYGDSKTPVWKTSSRSKYLTYTAPKGKYFATAKVTVAHTGGTKCGYAYSTNGGTTWVVAELDGLSATLNAITINFLENVNAFRISRNLTAQDGEKGSDSGNFYLAEACFTYENACTETTLTPDQETKTYNITDGGDFTKPTFTLKAGETPLENQTLTYTSSNPAIATVDEDGSVIFEGMTGTVTITAAYAGATIDEIEYCASEGSYTITVLCEDEEPKIIVAAGTNLDGCNNSITLEAKMQNDNSFTGGTYQWYRDGEAIEGATSASYTVVRAGTYTVSRTYTCTTMSSNSAVVTNENPEPKVERLTPFQYYHVNKTYSNQMKDRHLFAVTSYGTLDGKRYHLTATRNGDALNLSSSTAFFTIPSSDNAVDTVMIDLNELATKYYEGDEIVITCAPINNCNQVSTITSSITIHVIGEKPTLALICSGANGDGTRDTEKLVVGGDFLTGYNKADLCQQTGNKTFDSNIEWGFYEALQDSFIVTPVNGYAQFNKLNYEPFDILLLTDYPKSSKSEAAQKIIDDMAELCDYRPLLSFKTHFQSDKWKDKTTGEYKYTKWVKKGFTTAPVVPKQTATYVNIVCYAHPMFEDIDDINDQYTFHDNDDPNQLVYQVLRGPGYEGSKGIQGFELADADNFVTIGLVHYNAIADSVTHDGHTHISWNAEANDRLLVAMAERQTNIEARMMLFSLNCGAQSLQTPGGRNVILKCLEYLLETDPLKVADCRFTFDNGAGNTDFDPENYEGTGVKGDSLWSTAANWGPDYIVVPGRNNDVRIAAPCIVDGVKTKISVDDVVQENIQYYPEVLSIHITENGSLTIPANSSLTARSTILRADENGNVYPTNVADISLGSNADGNASLILNNERGDTKAGVAMYSKAKAGTGTTWQYIGTPHSDVSNATYNYYDSWIYSWNPSAGWEVVPTGGAVYPWVGYCITHPELGHTYWMEGTLVETTTQEIEVPSNSYQIIGNSWTAPIQIANFEETDFDGIETKTIYFFNTGSDPEGDNSLTPNATYEARWAPGTYIPVPIHSAEYTGEDTEIPSMQGFYVANNNPTSAGTLHLDYERHVRAPRKNTPSGPMHAPARISAKDDEPIVAKLLVRGKRYDDKLILLEREDFTGGYDSGWDGDKWDGGTISPTIWAVNEIGGADAVAAIPEFEGTVIGFRAGEDNIYTIHFDYDGMEEALYLLDTETKIYTRVLKGNSYTFACPDKAEHNRFILTRKAPQIATGTENIATGENAKAVKFIKDDKIFIFVNGILYDATGKMVIR